MYLTARFYLVLMAVVLLMAGGYVWPPLYAVGKGALWLTAALVATDAVLLWSRRGVAASRHCAERFSNGDDNVVTLRVDSSYPFAVRLDIIDEIPFVFQRRDVLFRIHVGPRRGKDVTYRLRPTERGAYGFGYIRVFATSPLRLVERRYTCGEQHEVKVYPSYLMLRDCELLAISNRLSDIGIKRIRRVGNNSEFEHIRDYTRDDEYRRINWKATARRGQLMVNVYHDERSQQVVSVIDKGRIMQQTFLGMSLLDYAVNATLALSYMAMYKEDKAGLATVCDSMETFVPPSRRSGHMQTLLEALYRQRSTYGETDWSALVAGLNRHLPKRSLLVLYTNFSGRASMERQLPYLRQLNARHRLLVVFFEDNELRDFVASPKRTTEDYYQHFIAEKFVAEQRLIVSLLRQQGILSVLTTPQNLSVDVINKYIELKSRQMLV